MVTGHPFDDAVLDEQIAIAAEDPDTAHDMGVFEVATMDRANRVVWRIGQLRSQLAEVKRLYSSERERLDAWLEDEQRRINGQVQFLQGLVEHYHRRLLAEDKRRKTVSLPYGKLEARKARDHWEIDDATLLAWAEENKREDLINRPAPTVDRNAVKKVLRPAAGGGECVALHCTEPYLTAFHDGVSALNLCEKHGDLLAVGFALKPSARESSVTENVAVTEDGEVVPGVVVHVADETDLTFSVKTPEADR